VKCKPIEQVNHLPGHKLMAMTKCYDHANEERYGEAIEALDEAGKTGSTEVLSRKALQQPLYLRTKSPLHQ